MAEVLGAVTPPHPGGRDRLVHLDGWRGWAVTLVLLGHFTPVSGINLGLLGVELFFVLSGRLMAEILFIRKTPLRTFFPRRINRVYPALLVFVLATSLASQFSHWEIGPKAVLTSLTFITNYNLWIPGLYEHQFVNHLWSLCVEEHSYIILALLVVASRAFDLKPLSALLLITAFGFVNGLLSMSVFGLNYFDAYWRTDVHIASITAAAAVHLWLSQGTVRIPPWMAPLTLCAGVALSVSLFPETVRYTLGTTLLAISVCSLETSFAWFRRLFDNPVAVLVGLYSYSIYLWQQPFYKMHIHGEMTLLAGLAATAVLAILSFHLVEGPMRTYLNERFTFRRPVSSSALAS